MSSGCLDVGVRMERRCRMVTAVDFSPIDPLVQADPYPWYAELRRGPAATYLPGDDLWVVSRFEPVRQVARQPELVFVQGAACVGRGRAHRSERSAA